MRGLLTVAPSRGTSGRASRHAGGPSLIVGAAEDDVSEPLTEAKAKLDLLKVAGLGAVRVTSIWDPAHPDPTADELNQLTT